MHPYLDWPGPIAFAHRGGNTVAPENTLAAFEHAVSLGYRYLETDVHLTTDGVLVAFHDADLKRTCGIDARIGDMSAADVSTARVDAEYEIPLMSELFELFPDARFNIDAKSDDAVEPLTRLVTEHAALDRVCLASFSLRSLRRMRAALGGRLITNMAPTEVAALRVVGRPIGRSTRCAQVPTSRGPIRVVDERFVAAAHRCGSPVHVWTINDRDEMTRLLDLGVDGIMTDDCDLLRSVLVERGQWVDG